MHSFFVGFAALRKTIILAIASFLFFALVSSASKVEAATVGNCASLGTITITSPLDGATIGGNTLITFSRDAGCTDVVDVYWAKRGQTDAVDCTAVNSWNYIATVENPGTQAVWNTSTVPLAGDDYCLRLKTEAASDARTADIINNMGAALITNVKSPSANLTSTGVQINWQTNLNDNGTVGGSLNTTGNTVTYGTNTDLENSGITQVSDTGDDVSTHMVALLGLAPNTTYYYRVKSVANGITTKSPIFSFHTLFNSSGQAVHRIDTVRSFGVPGGDFSTGWHFRFYVTANNMSEDFLQFKMSDWTNGSNTLPILGNSVYCLSATGVDFTTEEDIETNCLATVENDYTSSEPTTLYDAEPDRTGRQFFIDLYYKLPADAAGTYTTNYGIFMFGFSG